MGNLSDTLLVGGILFADLLFLVPLFSIGAALSYHWLGLPVDAPFYVDFLIQQNDPDHPRYLLGRVLVGDRYLGRPHSTHVLAGFINLFLLVDCNLMPVVFNVVPGPAGGASWLLRLFTIAFFVSELLWLW